MLAFRPIAAPKVEATSKCHPVAGMAMRAANRTYSLVTSP
jgi:hypothetical protein